MNHGQGFSASLATGVLVLAANVLGLPVSTTHVSVGAPFGAGLIIGQADIRVATRIALSWLVTLPCAAIISGVVYWTLQ